MLSREKYISGVKVEGHDAGVAHVAVQTKMLEKSLAAWSGVLCYTV
jgi:hypothetical protein